MKNFVMLLCSIVCVASLWAQDLVALKGQLAEAYETALDHAILNPSEQLKIREAFVTLTKEPSNLSALDRMRRLGPEAEEKSDDIRACAFAIYTLSFAAQQKPREFTENYEAFNKAFPKSVWLAQLDIAGLQQLCTFCNGANRSQRCPGCSNNNGKCKVCKGTGLVKKRTATAGHSSKMGDGFEKEKCTTCKGKGTCPVCKGVIKSCDICNNTSRVIDVTKTEARLSEMAGTGVSLATPRVQAEIDSRTETDLLDEKLRIARVKADPRVALEIIKTAAPTTTHAVQAHALPAIITALDAIITYQVNNTSEKVYDRRQIASAIERAQGYSDPRRGIEVLKTAIAEYPDADNLTTATTALDGLEASLKRMLEDERRQTEEDLDRIKRIKDIDTRIAQVEILLESIPEEHAMRNDLIAYREAQIAFKQDQRNSWWRKGAYIGGGVLALFIAYILIVSAIKSSKEAARKRRRKTMNIPSHFKHR